MRKLISYLEPSSPRAICHVDVSEDFETKLRDVKSIGKKYNDALQALLQESKKSDLPYYVRKRIKLGAKYNNHLNEFLKAVILSPDDEDPDDVEGFTNYCNSIDEWANFDFDENQRRLRERAAKLMPELADAFLHP